MTFEKPFDGTFKGMPEQKKGLKTKMEKEDHFIKILLLAVFVSAAFSGAVIFMNFSK